SSCRVPTFQGRDSMDKLIDDLRERVTVLEGVVLGGRIVRGQSATDRKLWKSDYAIREGVSTRTIERGIKKGIHTKPDGVTNGKSWWWLSSLQRFDRSRIRGATRRIGQSLQAE